MAGTAWGTGSIRHGWTIGITSVPRDNFVVAEHDLNIPKALSLNSSTAQRKVHVPPRLGETQVLAEGTRKHRESLGYEEGGKIPYCELPWAEQAFYLEDILL